MRNLGALLATRLLAVAQVQDLYALADALKPFKLSPSQVADVGVGRGLDTVHVMKLVALVCGIGVTQAKAAAIEAEYSMFLKDYQVRLLQDLADDFDGGE